LNWAGKKVLKELLKFDHPSLEKPIKSTIPTNNRATGDEQIPNVSKITQYLYILLG